MAKLPIRLVVVCLARRTFNFTAAEKLYREMLGELGKLEAVELELEAIPHLVIEASEAREAARTLTARMDVFLRRHDLTALAIRRWPEFAATYGISPCAAMSVLQKGR
jgi:L-fucose isomerase-like protein